jgi:tetratricopeptide (TPR) repeat protein
VRFAEAVLEHRSGRAEQARVMLEATVREHPGHRAARRYLAELQVANGEVAAAARHYAELLRTEAGDAQSAARLASLIVGEDAGLARRDVLRALEGELAAQMALARGVASLSDWGTLEQIAAQLRRGAPASDEALLLHVAAMRGLGRDEEAEQQCLDALNRSALRVSANLCLAVQALKQADLPQVVDRAERVLREQPDSVEARELLAQAYLRDRALDHARDQIEQLKQLRGGQPRAYALEGMLWAERGDAQAAVQAWQRSWELREDRSTLMPYARALQLVEQHAEAQLLLEGWLTVNPGDVSVRRAAATAALSAGQRRAALRHYQTLISLRPEDVIALNNLAWLYHEQGDKRALEYARSAYELDAKNPSVADTYGWLLAKSGRRVAGEQVLTQALTANPNNSGLRERLAAIRSL